MSDKDIKRLIDLAKDGLKKETTKEEALQSLVRAGILDKNGKYTKHYPNLARLAEEHNV
ncbi:hypothetical protein [Pedobacter hiemivivus]|jgi:hypothetical protein|uniref:hypothetical protein n=1 Tax=Pedobacter hiemivivus TaxID=2530454 RepID=UPI0013F1642A|nr:hypothetical protein [Pedobacter hiemivivus]